jgi:DNA-binding winged helix-turn-helix (wHTH) protein
MAVLLRLAAAGGNVVSRETLLADVWCGVVVTDFALSRCIYQLRKNLGSVSERRDSPIDTLPKRGYSLTWPVKASATSHEMGRQDVGHRRLVVTAFI